MLRHKLNFIALIAVMTVSTALAIDFTVGSTGTFVLAQTSDRRKAEADRLFQQGFEQEQNSQLDAAIKSWQQALTIYREINDRYGQGTTLNMLGRAYHLLKDYTKAIEYFQQALAIAREIKVPQAEAATLGSLGNVYLSQQDYAKAIEYYQQVLAIARQIKNPQLEAQAQQSLQLAQSQINPRKVLADKLRDQGLEKFKSQQFDAAIDLWQKALTIYREIKDQVGVGRMTLNIGVVYNSLGDYGKAIDYYQASLLIIREQDRALEAGVINNLGLTFSNLGEYNEAIKYFQKALSIARGMRDRETEAKVMGNLGTAYLLAGDYTRSTEYNKQYLAIVLELKDPKLVGSALGNMGIVYQAAQEYTTAIKYSEQSLKVFREIPDLIESGKALGNLGNSYYFQGNYRKAIDYFQQSLAIAKQLGDLDLEGMALTSIGKSLSKMGDLASAEKNLYAAIEAKESLRQLLGDRDNLKVLIFEGQSDTYLALQQVLIAQNKTELALEVAERGRAKAFVELLKSRLSPQPNNQFQLTAPKIEKLKQIAKSKNATLVEYSIIKDLFNIKGIQKSQESELYIWVIKPNGEVTFRQADLKPLWQKQNTTLEALVTTTRDSIGARGLGATYRPNTSKGQNKLKQLHELLIKPIADLLPTKDTDPVIFIPQASLFLAPFPALQDESGKYLIQKHTILTSPSIQLLDLTKQQRERVVQTANARSLIVGNPTMPKASLKVGEPLQQLSPLPGSETEAKAIASLFNTQPLIGNQATETAVVQLLPQARIVHLATHGLFDDIKGLGSAIALAPSGKDDGLLTAEEILNLKLNAELVVLSACDTGRGRITGDGVIGLSRSLISSGVPSVIVSLWAVPDAPTASLMTEFYQNLRKNPDKAQALRQAMLATIKAHPDPKDWAAFTLIGEAR